MSEETDQNLVIEGLVESNDILQGELEVIRNSNRMLRRINSIMRHSLDSLRNQVAIAQENDQRFKELCDGKFDGGTDDGDGGLLEPESTVKSTV